MPPDDPSLVFTPGKPRIGEIIISSPSISMLGTSRDRDAYFQRSYSLGQNLTFGRGRHSMRVGYDASFYRYIQDTCSNGCFGSYTFRTLTTFLQNVPRRLDARLPDAVNVKTLDQAMVGAYIQDNFRITPSFTLNLGLRYEYSSVPEERNGATSHVTDLTLETPLAQLNEPGALYKNPMAKAFSPRVGFAWAPGDAKTSIRGGFGVYYEHPGFYHIRTALQEQLPFNQLGTHRRHGRQPSGTSASFPGCLHHAGRHACGPRQHARVPVRPGHLVRLSVEPHRTAAVRDELGRERGLHGLEVHESLVAGPAEHPRVAGVPAQPTGPEVLPRGGAAHQPRAGRCADSVFQR